MKPSLHKTGRGARPRPLCPICGEKVEAPRTAHDVRQLAALDGQLCHRACLDRRDPAPRPLQTRSPAERAFSRSGVTYQLERVKCGKRRCQRCKGGPAHGPYWYAYYWSKGRTASKYVGKKLPADLGDVDVAGESGR